MKALIVVDMLNDFILKEGALYSGERGENIINFINERIEEFRNKDYPIIFLCDNHEVDDKEFEMFPPHCIVGEEGSRIIKDMDFKAEDKVIKKRRYSGFFSTDLDIYLREKEVDEIYLVGVCTNICVLYTAADGRNLGYKVNIYEDGVASFDEEAHKFALKEAKQTLGCNIL
ncbi:cysteine hydrolase [Anaerosalibacter bizertensis]|uniref:Cysteine hydrolase n=1 Tax=Anaerosalibacter bizertensis TaxID=932217 RepID=A0A844FKG7_9FIRM|nr:isochorismatase family cysteine hydrolase [Anaerosalibacter bizertensis]MSS44441.1 cysteine hydrolase [Anaerosalibacter bizertensis]